MLFTEIVAVDGQNHTKPINKLRGHIAELLAIKTRGTYSYH